MIFALSGASKCIKQEYGAYKTIKQDEKSAQRAEDNIYKTSTSALRRIFLFNIFISTITLFNSFSSTIQIAQRSFLRFFNRMFLFDDFRRND